MIKSCKQCSINIIGIVYRPSRTIFCSIKCAGLYKIGRKLSEDHKKKISLNNGLSMLGKNHTEHTKRIQSVLKIGKPSPKTSGSNHWNWQGGITEENKKIRKSLEYKKVMRNIMERDNYMCQLCGVRGYKLQVDHIKPFKAYPSLRLEPNNLRTLCELCHRKTDTWGSLAKNYQLNKINI